MKYGRMTLMNKMPTMWWRRLQLKAKFESSFVIFQVQASKERAGSTVKALGQPALPDHDVEDSRDLVVLVVVAQVEVESKV